MSLTVALLQSSCIFSALPALPPAALMLLPSSRRRRLVRKGGRPPPKQWQWLVLVLLAALTALWLLFLLLIHFRLGTPADDPFPCSEVYFWGGGKAGSTTLAALLKHGYEGDAYDPNSEFIDSPKEICWAERGQILQRRQGFASGLDGLSKWRAMTHGHKCHPDDKHFALDACPRYNTREHAELIMEENPHAKFLMLIRNPVDRLISNINDVRRGPAVDVEEAVRKLLERNVEGRDTPRDKLMKSRTKTVLDNQRRRLSEHLEGEILSDSNAIDDVRKVTYRTRKRDLLRERLIARRGDAAAWARGDRGSGGTLNQEILGQQGMGVLPQNFGHVSRMSRNHWELSLYGKNLQNLLSVVPASQVLIIQTEALSRIPQETVADVLDFIGASKPKKVKTLHENKLHDRVSYKTISQELRQELESAFEADHALLLQQLGDKTFPWSWLKDETDAGIDDDWLTTTPVPDNRT